MRQQQQSKTIKKGEPIDHAEAVNRVFNFLYANKKNRKWLIDINVPLIYDAEFVSQLPKGRYPGHKEDIGIYLPQFDKETGEIRKFVLKAVVSVMGKHGGYWKNQLGQVKKYSPTKHDKPIQTKNDKIVQNWCERKKIKYIVLLKEEILGDCGKLGKDEVDTIPYLTEKLAEFIK